MTTIERQWLNWDVPCLPQAAAWLIDRFAARDDVEAGACDLRRVLCVLPGSRAGRLLLSELLRICKERGLRLVPPRVLTPGAMIDALLDVGSQPLASPLESKLAWLTALQSSSDVELAPLLPSLQARGPADDPNPWMELATKIASLHDELSGEMRTFADVAAAAESREMFGEGDRWRTLEQLHKKQRKALGDCGLTDVNDARRRALSRHVVDVASIDLAPTLFDSAEREGFRRVVLIGVADLNALQRLALQRADVTALVHAPSDESESFDELGAVRIESWTDRHMDLKDVRITVVEKPVDQAQAAMGAIAQLAQHDASLSPSRITLGIGDSALIGDMEVAAGWAGLSTHDAAGRSLSLSAPWRLLDAAADFIEDRRFEHFAALLRHPDLERAVVRSAGAERAREQWLSLLDEYFADHLHGRIDGAWLGDENQQRQMKSLWDAVHALLRPLTSSADERRPLNDWCQPLLDALANVYGLDGEAEFDGSGDDDAAPRLPPPDLRSIDACLELRNALQEIAFAAPPLLPTLSLVHAARLLLSHAASAHMTDDLEPDQIEMLGWLELHLDTAPALIIVGCNDGHIPGSMTADAFLPDTLRAQLNLMHSARRYARDAYLLQAIARSRPPHMLRLIAGRRSDIGDPLTPSRLLLACDDDTLVTRVTMFARDLGGEAVATPIGLTQPKLGAISGFVVPAMPAPLQPPAAMRITEFRSYLQCPYRWALERLLRLEAFDDSGAELDPMNFGTLVHDALCALGQDPGLAASDDSDLIFRFLTQRVRDLIRERHGRHPLPAILIQRARMEQRLRAFANVQALDVRDGWRIRHCEVEIKGSVSLDIPGEEPMPLRGRIDRIDENIRTGHWRVIDYKTGERGDGPIRVHHKSNEVPPVDGEFEWFDLQLPLYHLLVTREKGVELPADCIQLGYIVLPRRADGARWLSAAWTAKHIEHGLNRAREIVREIRASVGNGAFGRNRDIDGPWDTYARICQTAAFQPSVDADEGGEGDGASANGGDE